MTWQGLGVGLDLGISHGLGGTGAVFAGHRREVRSVAVAPPSPTATVVAPPSPTAEVVVA